MNKVTKLLVLMMITAMMMACGTENEAGANKISDKVEQEETVNNVMTELSMEVLSSTEETSSDEFRYVEFEGEVIISEFIGESEIVVIPDEINGCPVIEISRTAFRNNETVKAVRIGNNIKIINDQVFGNCSSLEFVIFGDNVESVGDHSFVGCNNLKEIRLNEGLLTIGELVFPNTVEPLVIPRSVIEIGEGALSQPIQVYAGSYAEEFMETYATYYEGYTYEVIE